MLDSSGHQDTTSSSTSDYRLDMSARESDECEGYEISSAASCHGKSADGKAAAKAR